MLYGWLYLLLAKLYIQFMKSFFKKYFPLVLGNYYIKCNPFCWSSGTLWSSDAVYYASSLFDQFPWVKRVYLCAIFWAIIRISVKQGKNTRGRKVGQVNLLTLTHGYLTHPSFEKSGNVCLIVLSIFTTSNFIKFGKLSLLQWVVGSIKWRLVGYLARTKWQ